MQKYVVGFVFDPALTKVMLIEKNKPEWMDGLLNGVGGKVEPFEDFTDAMSRECLEESGLSVDRSEWTWVANIQGSAVSIAFFFAISNNLAFATSLEAERIVVDNVATFLAKPIWLVPNLQWLLPLCQTWHSALDGKKYIDPFWIYTE